ncbi:MAG: hypothetical protein ACLQAT_32065, partial [Candidatus Binataceae bacterium]
PHLLVHGTDLSPRHPLLPPAMTSNLLPMLPVYFVTDLAGPYPLVFSPRPGENGAHLFGRKERVTIQRAH